MRAAAHLTDRIRRKLGGPFDRDAWKGIEELIAAAFADVMAAERQRVAGELNVRAQLYDDELRIQWALRAAAEQVGKRKE